MAEVDEKVVSMRFDNHQFEQGVSQSINTLHKLKDSLNLDKSAKSLEALEQQAGKFNISGINKAAESAGKAFSAMGAIGFSVMNRLSNEIINLGINITRNLTAPIRQGMQTYEQQIKATQTTMNALNLTGAKGEEKVRYYLKDLNKYSDETIYRFSDMTTSLSKFVSAGVNINDATKAIKGLGNVAALSGADTMQFSRAIYNISQSLGMGKLITRDWMSIENANMATKEFKETLIDTAKQMGYIDKEGKLTSKGLAGVSKSQQKALASMNINYKNFRDSLSGGWLKNDVLMGALKRYADETDALGKKGKAAATEVKTFTQLLDTLGDSLATKWSNIYTDIIGNFNEAKKFWTGVSNVLDTLLVKPLESIEHVASKWKDLGGRSEVLNSFKMQLQGFKAVFESIKAGWEAVFPKEDRIKRVMALTNAFRALSYIIGNFLLKSAKPIAYITAAIASALKIVINIVKSIMTALQPVFNLVGNIILLILDVLGYIGQLITGMTQGNKAVNNTMTVAQKVAAILTPICNGIGKAIYFVVGSILKLINVLTGNDNVGDAAESATDKASRSQKKISPILQFFMTLGGFLQRVGKLIGAAASQIFKSLDKAFSGMNDILDDSNLTPFERLYEVFNMIFSGAFVANLIKGFNDVTGVFDKFGNTVGQFGEAIKRLSKALSSAIKSYANKQNAEALKTFAASILILSVSLVALASIKPDRIWGAVGAIGALMSMLVGAMGVMNWLFSLQNKTDKTKKGLGGLLSAFAPNQVQQFTKAMIMMSVAVAILASSMAVLGQLKWTEVLQGGLAVAGLMLLLIGIAKLMSMVIKSAKGMMSGAMALTTIAFAVKMLAKSVEALGTMDTDQLIQGLVSVGIILGAFVGTLALVAVIVKKCAPQLAVLGATMLMLAPAVLVLSAAFAVFSAVSWDGVWRGITAIGLILAMFLASAAIMTQLPLLMATLPILAASFMLLAPALLTLSAAFAVFGAVPWDGVWKGVAAIGLVLAMFTGAAAIMSVLPLMMATMPVLAISFMLLAPALVTLSAAFAVFGKVPWDGVWKGIAAIGLLLAMVTAVSAIMSILPLMMATMPILAVSISILAPAIVVLASSFAIFSAVSWDGVLKGIIAIGALMGLMTLFAGIMTIFPLMMVAMPIMAASFTALAPAIILLATAMNLFSQVTWKGVATGVVTMLAFMGFAVIFGTLAIIAYPGAKAMVVMAEGMVILATAFIGFSNVKWGGVAKGVTVMLAMVGAFIGLSALISFFPQLILGMVAVIALLKVVSVVFSALSALNLTNLGESFVVFAKKIAEGIKLMADQGKHSKKGIQEVSEVIQAMALALAIDNSRNFYNSGASFIQDMVSGMLSQMPFFQSGLNTVISSVNNFTPYASATAYSSGAQIGDNLIRGFRGPKGIADPYPESKKTNQGLKTVDNSLVNSTGKLSGDANNLGGTMGNSLTTGFGNTAIPGMQGQFNVLDNMYYSKMAEYQAGFASFNAMAGGSIVGVNNKKKWDVKNTTMHGGEPYYEIYKNGKFYKKIPRSKLKDYEPTSAKKTTLIGGQPGWNLQTFGLASGSISDADLRRKYPKLWKKVHKKDNKSEPPIAYDVAPVSTTPTTGGGIGGGSSSHSGSKKSKGSGSKKKVKDSKWGTGKIPKGFKLGDNGWNWKNYFKFGKTYDSKANERFLKKSAGYITDLSKAIDKISKGQNPLKSISKYKDLDDRLELTKISKHLDVISKSVADINKSVNNLSTKKISNGLKTAFTKYYATTDEYKEAKNSLDVYNDTLDKEQTKLNKLLKKRKQLNAERKKINKNTAKGKAQLEAIDKVRKKNDDEISSTKDKIKDLNTNVQDLTKTIEEGPAKAFEEMYENVQNTLKDAMKITSLSADAGFDIFNHFQYSGTKSKYESGKQAHNLAAYSTTQAKAYENYIDDFNWLQNSGLSESVIAYFTKLGVQGKDTLHALRYSAIEDIQTINDSFDKMGKANSETLARNYKQRKEDIKKWGENLKELAERGLDPKVLKELIDAGYSDDNNSMIEGLLGMSDEDLKGIKSDEELIANTTADIFSGVDIAWGDTYIAKALGLDKTDSYLSSVLDFSKTVGSLMNQLYSGGNETLKPIGANFYNAYLDAQKKGFNAHQTGRSLISTILWIAGIDYDKQDKKAIESIVQNIIDGFGKGFNKKSNYEKAGAMFDAICSMPLNTILEMYEIHSPSKVMERIGENIVDGLTIGIQNRTGSMADTAKSSAKAILTGYGALSQIDTSTLQPTVAPVLDTDSLAAQMDQISGFMTDTTANLASQIQNQLDTNKAITEFNTAVEYDDSNLIAEIESLHSDMMQLQNAISSMKVQMDTGALVGQIAPQIDRTLGQRATMGRR